MGISAHRPSEKRALPRDEVHFRTRGHGTDGQSVGMLVVNLSAQGLMFRTDHAFDVGDRVTVTLPVVGAVVAHVRWSLGGRVGCELDRLIGLADYYEMLATMIEAR